jgi:hypothetical protein
MKRANRAQAHSFTGAIMSQIPCIAVVIESGQLHSVILEDWPDRKPPPDIAVVDFDAQTANEKDLIHFTNGGDSVSALAYRAVPRFFLKSMKRARAGPPRGVSPKAVLAAIDERDARAHHDC